MPRSVPWKRQATALVLAGVVLIGVVGCVFFLIALSPVRLDLEPGTMVSYTMTTEIYSMDDDRPRSVDEQKIHLVCIDDGNKVALVSPGGAGERDELTLMRLDQDGTARRYDPALRLQKDGKSLGFFDFNLFPLPEGLNQDWRVELQYAVLPIERRRVSARVRRVANGFNPQFELTLPTLEWTEVENPHRRAGQAEQLRWHQIRNLVCRYRFNGRSGVVDQAELAFIAGKERSDGIHQWRIRIALRGEVETAMPAGDAMALRDLAVASLGAQAMLEDNRRRDLGPIAQELRTAAADSPAVLRRLAFDLARAVDQDPPSPFQTWGQQASQWVVQIAAVRPSRRAPAQSMVDQLNADGFQAWLTERDGLLLICVGPFAHRDDTILHRLRERLPRERPIWRAFKQ